MTPFRTVLPFLLLLLTGCLGEPGVEELWTRLDIASPTNGGALVVEDGSVTVAGSITYRRILTGSVIVEVRVSDVIGPEDVNLDPAVPRMDALHDVETILSNSRAVGGTSMPVTGWDHLIHSFELTFEAGLPADPGPGAIFVLLYFGEVEEIETPSGGEQTVFHPADFEEMEILPAGAEILTVAGPQGAGAAASAAGAGTGGL